MRLRQGDAAPCEEERVSVSEPRRGFASATGPGARVSFPELFAFELLQFPDETLRSGELLNMIVAVIDSFQVRRGPVAGEGGSTCTKPQRLYLPVPKRF